MRHLSLVNMSFLGLRKLFPAALDTLSYSCSSRTIVFNRTATAVNVLTRQCSTDGADRLSENDVVNPLFTTRNPRNLERLAIAKKPKGWNFQYPPVSFYHRLRFEKTNRYVTGWVEHNSGRTILTASTREFAIAKHMFSLNDVASAQNVGRILGQRCLEAGIDCIDVLEPETGENSEKYQAFRDAIAEAGIQLSEPAEVKPHYEPGIDYDNTWEVENLNERQMRVGAKRTEESVFQFGLKKRFAKLGKKVMKLK